MKIVFMGTPDFAKESLKALYEAKHEILAVVTNPDRPSGRGMKLNSSPVKQYAEEVGLPIYQPEKIRGNNEFIEQIKQLNPEVICVVAYGKILPEDILKIPQKGCINVHGSLLPKYRGAAPIQWSVINGDKTTGVTTMYMENGMDTGDMILKEEIKIGEDETTGEVWGKLAKIGGELLVKTLKKIEEGTAPRIKQGEDFSIAPMLKKEDTKLDWENMTAVKIKNLVRGLNPIMGAYTFIEGKKIKIWKVQVISEQLGKESVENEQFIGEAKPGQVIISEEKKGLYIKAKEGIIKVIEIQGENSKKMNVEDYLRGNKIEVGKIFN
jgi:methionyl-tRNA formyltransferase